MQGATANQQQRFDAAWNDLQKRLRANNGKNPCAKLFGGLAKAQQALGETVFKFDYMAGDNAQTDGRNVTIGTMGQFMASNGRMPDGHFYGPDATTHFIFAKTNLFTPIVLGDVENASFILAHELGHRRKIYGGNNDDGMDLNKNTKNNRKIWEACFK